MCPATRTLSATPSQPAPASSALRASSPDLIEARVFDVGDYAYGHSSSFLARARTATECSMVSLRLDVRRQRPILAG